MKKLRIGILTDKQNIGEEMWWQPIAATILPFLQNLFSSVNPGEWDATHTHFIPGDIQLRQQWTAQRIAQYGVQLVVDQNKIYDLLTTPGDWNAAIDNYLGYLKTGLANGTITPGNTSNPLISAGFDTGTLLMLGLVGAAVYMVYKSGRK